MIDRRHSKEVGACEMDPALLEVSDHEIVMTFRDALESITPCLAKIRANAGDPWDDISEGLFYSMVHLTFAGKYGIPVDSTQIHKYGFSKHCYRRIFHIECIPRNFPLPIWIGGELRQWQESELAGRFLVFRAFVGSNGSDPSLEGLDAIEPPDFGLVAIDIAESQSGLRFREFGHGDLFLDPNDVKLEWVAEDFDANEHRFHKEVFFEDLG